MTPVLANVHMLTDLNITGQFSPFNLLVKPSGKPKCVRIGGWSNYINTFKTNKKNVTDKECKTLMLSIH